MTTVTCTLVTDGSSDRVLIPMIESLLDVHCPGPYRLVFAQDIGPGFRSLASRLEQAIRLFPCDILFVHRDAERENLATRVREIDQALREAVGQAVVRHVCVVPIRMTESWLLVDEQAIRTAAGNAMGRTPLRLPRIDRLESLPDPKQVLFEALRAACGLPPQRKRRFNPEQVRHRVSELMTQTDRLRRLTSFQHLEQQIEMCFQQ